MRLALALLLAAASAAGAAPVSQVESFEHTAYEWAPVSGVEAAWNQGLMVEGGWTLASQHASDYPFYAETADDFVLGDSRPVVAVEWWGAYWNPGAPPCATSFYVRFYENDAGSRFPRPGAMVYEQECAVFVEELLPDQSWWYRYYCDLTGPFPQLSGETYWLSVQAVYPWYEGGQWGWGECSQSDHWAGEAVHVFDALGVPYWTPLSSTDPFVHRECAFSLYVDEITPVEISTWSRVKALFR